MNNRIKLYFANFLVMAAGLWMASCSASDDNLVSDKGADVAKNEKVLTLRINTGTTSFGSRTTDITADPGATAENTINRLTIGIFSSDGSTLKCIKELTETGADSFKKNGTNGATATILTSSLANDDKVLVAVNAPVGTFSSVSKASDFNAKTEQAIAALTYTATEEKEHTVEENNNIPMYGESKLAATGNTGKEFTATVQVKHLLAKVTLESLSVDFQKNEAYSSATFTPTAIFLINEPDALLFNNDAWETTVTSLFQGYKKDDVTHGAYKECLSTQALAGQTALSGAKGTANCSFAPKYYFYTMPNNEIQTNGKNTKLVIAGNFVPATGKQSELVYYPVALNAKVGTDGVTYEAAETGSQMYKVYPNKNYKCTVVIKAKGAASPFDNLDPKKATITVTVSPFTDVAQTTVFK